MGFVVKFIRHYVWVFLLLVASFVFANTPIPTLTSPVMDTANMLSSSFRQQLAQELLLYSQQKGSQIIVLTVDNVQPETPFDFGTRAFDQWQVGRKGVDDGVIFLLVKNERKSQILVGRGLEGAIPDAYAKRILNDIVPDMRTGNTDAAVRLAVTSLQTLIDGESLPDMQSASSSEGLQGTLLGDILIFLLIILTIVWSNLPSVQTAAFIAPFSFALAFLVTGSIFLALLITVFILLFGLGKNGSAFTGGSGSLGGGNFGGGGFGGGGGRFGGGGASGGW